MKKFSQIILSIFITLILNQLADAQVNKIADEVILIADLSNLSKSDSTARQVDKQSIEELEQMFEPYFEKGVYIASANKHYIDSLFTTSPKTIKIEKRWYKKIAKRCCFGTGACWTWAANARVSIKNNTTSEFLFEELNTSYLPQKVLEDYQDRSSANETNWNKKIIIEKRESDVHFANYFIKLKEEFGSENIIFITTLEDKIKLKNENKSFIKVIFSLQMGGSYIAEFVDSNSGKILRTDEVKDV